MRLPCEVIVAVIISCVQIEVTFLLHQENDESCPGLEKFDSFTSHINVRHQPSCNRNGAVQFDHRTIDCPTVAGVDGIPECSMAAAYEDELSPHSIPDEERVEGRPISSRHPCTDLKPSATFVTALYDIGRGQWKIFPRPYALYLQYFKDVLKLNVSMVALVEETDESFVWETRTQSNLTNLTRVWTKPFSDLPLCKHLESVRHVVESDEFKKDNGNLRHPEGFSAEYIILMNSKLAFLKEVAEANPFCTTHFVWIDAGYGHGKNVLPTEGVEWIPRDLIALRDKLTIIQLERPELYEYYSESVLFKMAARPAFSGGFFGGDSFSINHLASVHEDVFETMLEKGIVHEDQMMMLWTYFRKPDYFNRVTGWWYDGYRLFH